VKCTRKLCIDSDLARCDDHEGRSIIPAVSKNAPLTEVARLASQNELSHAEKKCSNTALQKIIQSDKSTIDPNG
jgi:hypothetical protein